MLRGNVLAQVTGNEQERLHALRSYCVLDTPPEPVFDHLTRLGAALFQVPIVLISLLDEHRQFFKSAVGLQAQETPRDSSFCAHTILADDPLVVLDAFEDERFCTNDLVVGTPHIRFYAGASLVDKHGMKLGSFCVIGQYPRKEFGAEQQALLSSLAALTVNELEQRLLPTRLAQTQERLHEAHERFLLATQATEDGIWDCDCLTGQVYYSGRLRSLVGLEEQDHLGSIEEWFNRLHPDDAAQARQNMAKMRESGTPHFKSEYRIRHEDGSWHWMQNRGIAVRGAAGKLTRLVGSVSDITSQRIRDAVTGLHTRTSLLTALDWRMRTEEEQNRGYALLFIDLDDFKRFNDSLGHDAGNCILVELGRRIQQTLATSPRSLAARLTSDEFAVLLDGVATQEDALTYAHCLEYILEASLVCGTQPIRVSASIGIAMGDAAYTKAEHLLHDADLAMHQAKMNGKAQSSVFGRNLRHKARQKMTLESELRQAVQNGSLVLHYQPKVILVTGEIVGFEALIRWNHPDRGLVAPDLFIPLAEESDLILEVGRFTLRESVRQLAEWRTEGLVSETTTMAVNLSAKQFNDRQIVETVLRKLTNHNLPPACLELEVTEGVLIHNATAALEILKQLKGIGVSLALDDFGTGYSSLSYLQRFPFDSLKIDRSFMRDLSSNEETTAITESIVALGRALKLQVVAEGIETREQATRVQAMGCRYAQGYLFSKAVSAEQVRKLLEGGPQRPTSQELCLSVSPQKTSVPGHSQQMQPSSRAAANDLTLHTRSVFFHDEAEGAIANASRMHETSQLILDAAGDGIYGLDLNGYVTFLNPAAHGMTGWSIRDLQGHTQHSMVHHSHADGSHYPREECPIYQALRDGQVHHREDEVFWRKDGSSFPVSYTSTPILRDGKPIGAVIVFSDITVRVREQAWERCKTKVFSSIMEQRPLRETLAYLADAFTSYWDSCSLAIHVRAEDGWTPGAESGLSSEQREEVVRLQLLKNQNSTTPVSIEHQLLIGQTVTLPLFTGKGKHVGSLFAFVKQSSQCFPLVEALSQTADFARLAVEYTA